MTEPGRPCSICTHDHRSGIESVLLAGESLRDIAGQFGVSKSALSRHARSCIPQLMASESDAFDEISAKRLNDDLNELRRVTLAILDEARGDGNHREALHAIARLESQIELVAKLAGELIERREVHEVSMLVDAQWLVLRGRVLVALRPHPVALAAVLAELSLVEVLTP